MDPTDALSPLLQVSILGPVVVLLAFACYWLVRELIKVHEKRTVDAQKFAESATVVAEALSANTDAINAVLEYHKDLLRLVAELSRRGRS